MPPAELQEGWIPLGWDEALWHCTPVATTAVIRSRNSDWVLSCFPSHPLVLYMNRFYSCGSKPSCKSACLTLPQMMWYSCGPQRHSTSSQLENSSVSVSVTNRWLPHTIRVSSPRAKRTHKWAVTFDCFFSGNFSGHYCKKKKRRVLSVHRLLLTSDVC